MARAILWTRGAYTGKDEPGEVLINNYTCDDYLLVPENHSRIRAWFGAGWRIEPGAPPTTENATTTILLHHE